MSAAAAQLSDDIATEDVIFTEKFAATAAVEAEGDDVWSKLPGELLARVSFLSLPTLFRCRAVCKRWNNLISSPTFSTLCAQAPIQKSHVILLGLPGLSSLWLAYMFDTRVSKWYHPIDLRFLQPCWDAAFGATPKAHTRRRILAACGPMLCVAATDDDGAEVLLACNPIAKTCEKLPMVGTCPPFGAAGLVDMVVDAPATSYKIFYLEFLFLPSNLSQPPGDKCSHLYVYESIAASWKTVCRIPKALYHEQSVDRCSAVHFKDAMYTLWYEDSPSSPYLGDGTHVLMAYQMQQRAWTDVGSRARLVVSRARGLLLVGALEDSYHIWELAVATRQCVEVARMPDFYYRRMLDDPFNALICGFGDAVFLMSAKGKPVLYDLAAASWQRLPALGHTLHDALPHFVRCNLFQNFVAFCMDVPISF